MFLIGMLIFGTYLGGLRFTLSNLYLYGLHKSMGVLALALILMRLIWTLASKPPKPLAENVPRIHTQIAKITHLGLYTCMIAMPLSGWITCSKQAGTNAFMRTPPEEFYLLPEQPDCAP